MDHRKAKGATILVRQFFCYFTGTAALGATILLVCYWISAGQIDHEAVLRYSNGLWLYPGYDGPSRFPSMVLSEWITLWLCTPFFAFLGGVLGIRLRRHRHAGNLHRALGAAAVLAFFGYVLFFKQWVRGSVDPHLLVLSVSVIPFFLAAFERLAAYFNEPSKGDR